MFEMTSEACELLRENTTDEEVCAAGMMSYTRVEYGGVQEVMNSSDVSAERLLPSNHDHHTFSSISLHLLKTISLRSKTDNISFTGSSIGYFAHAYLQV
ncbi:hypothetical protein GJ744_000637 [Endocarpon pusillum]|uniref:Uncharacterized protein n=1 Tax=Endocarpon pusillum TaxID=364733 RepID=A0A8H7E148_9EURO|nr:hypothetical protein GJ744_000637 [Endocarpon pusillum]